MLKHSLQGVACSIQILRSPVVSGTTKCCWSNQRIRIEAIHKKALIVLMVNEVNFKFLHQASSFCVKVILGGIRFLNSFLAVRKVSYFRKVFLLYLFCNTFIISVCLDYSETSCNSVFILQGERMNKLFIYLFIHLLICLIKNMNNNYHELNN